MDTGLLGARWATEDETSPRSTAFKCCCFRSKHNHNVVLAWVTSLIEGAGDSIWNGMVTATFIYQLMGNSERTRVTWRQRWASSIW